MRILVTNDDGISAEGIRQLVQELKDLGEIIVVAPLGERSACGHGITVYNPIKVLPYNFEKNILAWSVDGTPADCVKLGITTLIEKKPDIVISGINRGPNLGTDILYSGTVSAAIEGIISGVPSVAISQNSFKSTDFTYAARLAKKICCSMLEQELAPDTLLNINVPVVENFADIKGVKITKLGERKYINNFEHRKDPRGNDYYWLIGQVVSPENHSDDLDVVAIKNNYVSVTPIHFDLTNYRIMNQIKKWGLESNDFNKNLL